MKSVRLYLFVCIFLFWADPIHLYASNKDELLVMFWNLENFFDWKNDGTSTSEMEFSSEGERRWTKGRFFAKRNAVVKSLLWIGSKYGRMPDIIGVAEIENSFVLRSLIYSDALRKYDYGYVHYDSPDPRGIDVGLLFRNTTMSLVDSAPVGVGKFASIRETNDSLSFVSRDILRAAFTSDIFGKVNVLVNHHPSKYGGNDVSYFRRSAVLKTLRYVCDSLVLLGERNIIAMGDFNDTPDADAFDIIKETLCDKSDKLYEKGRGTIRFRGKWELIDLFFVSEDLKECADMFICEIPFLLVKDCSYAGYKPLRTFSGPRYTAGVSDHLPIVLKLFNSD